MVWSGILMLFGGTLLTFAVRDDPGGVNVTLIGAAVMLVGAALVIAGVLRLHRARRRARRRLPGGPASGGVPADYRTGTGKTVAMIAAVLYIISPIDFIPEVLLPLGVVDDATALTWLVFAIGQEMTRHSRKRHEVH